MKKQLFDNADCRVLNAGSILLLPTGTSSSAANQSIGTKIRHSSVGNKGGSFKISDMSLSEGFNDRIEDDNRKIIRRRRGEEEDIEEEDEEEEEEEEDEDEEEEEDEEESCDNCFTRTKYGNYVYKYVYKPLVRPIKFIYYSVAENLKLFKLLKFTIFAFCNFVLSFFYEAPFYFINSYMIENGSSSSQAGTVTVAVGIVSVFSSSRFRDL